MAYRKLTLDYETRSRADLKKTGAIKYAQDPSTEIICVGYKIGNGPAIVFDPALESPKEFYDALFSNQVVKVAHNALFEQAITRYVLLPKYLPSEFAGVSTSPIFSHSFWTCTAAKAAAHALPRNLEGAALALGLPIQKDMDGRRLVLKYCKPRKHTKWDKRDWHDNPTELQKIFDYCAKDVEVEALLDEALPDLIQSEQELWELDQLINFNGVQVDSKTINTILKFIEIETGNLKNELQGLTLGLVESASQRNELLNFLIMSGVNLPDLKAKTVEDAVKDGRAQGEIKRLLEIRQAVSKTSTAKYQAFKERLGPDNRVRDLLLYHGATTGRFSGVGIQPQNFPRGSIEDTDQAIEIIKTGDLDFVRLVYGDPMRAFSSCLRGMITASKGKELFCADYAAIEARELFWIAGHAEGVKAFEEGRDLYKEMAAIIFGKDVSEVTKFERQLGKAAVLGCLAKGTAVKTKSGDKKIEDVEIGDEIWDGTKWVSHEGLLAKGQKSVMRLPQYNLELTPDHWILQEGVWITALESLESKPPQSALRLEPPRLSGPSLEQELSAVSRCAAYVELKKAFGLISFGLEKILYAQNAPSLLTANAGATPETVTSFLIENLEAVGRLVTTTLGKDASIILAPTSRGTAVAVFDSPSAPQESFWNTLLHLAGLTSTASRWTELITMGTMSPETYELLLKKLTMRTEETYDLKNAGPLSRFQAGSAIVHNCGYQMGHKKFLETCLAAGLKIEEEIAETAVAAYRATHYPVKALWGNLERAACLASSEEAKGRSVTVNKTRWFKKDNFLYCELPSKRRLAYYGPELRDVKTPWGIRRQLHHWYQNSLTRKWEFGPTYGGLLTENVVQAVSRDLMAAAMLRLQRAGYEILLTVHDELLAERKRGEGSVSEFERLMTELPEWAQGSPVSATGWKGERYRK